MSSTATDSRDLTSADVDSAAPCPSSRPPPTAASPGSSARQQSPKPNMQQTMPPSPLGKRPHKGGPGDKPKAKRKRTKPEDKAILLEAYERNPNPTKEGYQELAKRVDMTFDGVRIWFQNHRQILRRKAQPLSPQVLEAVIQGRMRILSPDAGHVNRPLGLDTLAVAATSMSPPERDSDSSAHSDTPSSNPNAESGDGSRKGSMTWDGTGSSPSVETAASASSQRPDMSRIPHTDEPASSAPLEGPVEPRPALSRSFSATTSYLANRRNVAGASLHSRWSDVDDLFRSREFPSTCPPFLTPGANLDAFTPRSSSQSSQFRLSMSLDGRAEITEATSSPSRPRASSTSVDCPQSLDALASRRSSIFSPPVEVPNRLFPTASQRMPPRLRRGRSSDVQAWEDCANAENREDPLIRQAKHESSGSAIAAISLVRSTSSASLSSLDHTRNSARRRGAVGKAVPAKRPKLGRSASSLARMETAFAPSQRPNLQQPARMGGLSKYIDVANTNLKPRASLTPSLSFMRSTGNDSDKENWSPDEDGNPRPRPTRSFRRAYSSTAAGLTSAGRRPLPSGPPTSKLGMNMNGSGSGSGRNPRRTTLQDPRGITSLTRGNTEPGSWGSYGHGKLARSRSLGLGLGKGRGRTSEVEIYEDDDDEDENRDGHYEDGGEGAGYESDNGEGEGGDDEEEEDDDEAVRRFMGGVVDVSPSKKAAAAGLLSLMQGR